MLIVSEIIIEETTQDFHEAVSGVYRQSVQMDTAPHGVDDCKCKSPHLQWGQDFAGQLVVENKPC